MQMRTTAATRTGPWQFRTISGGWWFGTGRGAGGGIKRPPPPAGGNSACRLRQHGHYRGVTGGDTGGTRASLRNTRPRPDRGNSHVDDLSGWPHRNCGPRERPVRPPCRPQRHNLRRQHRKVSTRLENTPLNPR